MSEWISVKDAKPALIERDGDYGSHSSDLLLLYVPIDEIISLLKFARGKFGNEARYLGRYWGYNQKFRPEGSLGYEDFVTHWMPLPDPPKESP